MANKISPFRFWCQKVLPSVYDDSLSYYELLNKVVYKLNEVIENENSLNVNFEILENAFDTLKNWVENYLNNLDVQDEINNKLDEMMTDGELGELFDALGDELRTYNSETRELLQNEFDDMEQEAYDYNETTRGLMNEEINRIRGMVGSPKTATSLSGMTDTTSIYVYVGETTASLTNGYWYYNNGSTWVEGGIYNSEGIETDKSLSVSDMAADAKVTGEKINATYLDIEGNVPTSGIKYYKKGGVITSGKKWYGTNLTTQAHVAIPVNPNDKITLKANSSAPTVYACLKSDSPVENADADFCDSYAEDGRVVVNANDTASFTIPIDCVYLYLVATTTNTPNHLPVSLTINDVEKISNIRKDVYELNNKISDNLKSMYIESSNFDLSKTKYIDNYLRVISPLTNTHTNFVWFNNSNNKNIVHIPIKIYNTYNNARIALMDYNETVIYCVVNIVSSGGHYYFAFNAWSAPATMIPAEAIISNIEYDDTITDHIFSVVYYGNTVFLYLDGSYQGKVNCINKLDEKLSKIGVGFRGDLTYNSYYSFPKFNKIEDFAHISFDDQIGVLKNINDNANVYNSIFDNPDPTNNPNPLYYLKQLHDTYGCVFTINLFYQNAISDPTFDLSDMTTNFKTEFENNSSWLKFAYHSELPEGHASTDMTTNELITSVEKMYTAIKTFAGECCIDKCPRFGYFDCTQEQLIALKENKLIQGVLTRDIDTSSSLPNYNLTSDERTILKNFDNYTDFNHDIVYFRSEHRLDTATSQEIITTFNELYNTPKNKRQFVIFSHTIMADLTKINDVVEWCFKHGMKFDYPINHLTY